MSKIQRHTFRSPAWECEVCLVPWPCPDRRIRLLRRYRDGEKLPYLREMMRNFMDRARKHLDLTEDEFQARFVGWTFVSNRQIDRWLAELRRATDAVHLD